MKPEEKALIEFAKWFIHSRRMGADKMETKYFASNLMSELCHKEPFVDEHPLITEFKNQTGYNPELISKFE